MKYMLAVFTALTLAACQHQIPDAPKSVSFEGPQYRMNVARVEVVDDYPPTPAGQRPEHKPKLTLGDAMHTWADARLVAAGTENVLELHIVTAQITKKELPKQKSGIEGFLTKEQTEEYDGQLSVELRLYAPDRTLPVAHAEVSTQLSHSLREDATLEDRKALYRNMTAEMIADINKALESNIRSYFSNYLL